MIGGAPHAGPGAEGIDLRPIAHELMDRILVETAAGDDPDVWEAGLVEHLARLPGERDQVTAVDADSQPTGRTELLDGRDRMLDPGDRVVRVDTKRHASGKVVRVSAERLHLGRKCLDVGVRHGARCDQAMAAAGFDMPGGDGTD